MTLFHIISFDMRGAFVLERIVLPAVGASVLVLSANFTIPRGKRFIMWFICVLYALFFVLSVILAIAALVTTAPPGKEAIFTWKEVVQTGCGLGGALYITLNL